MFGYRKSVFIILEGLQSEIIITEYLGVYYQNDNPDVPNVNKTEKRIITYKIENK